MDRSFLTYYETELTHLRVLAGEFATLHPTVARNLSLDTVPCPDPYVERLLEGVAYLGARTRLKLDQESRRHVRTLLDALYPDLAGPAPAMSMAKLLPGAQVDGMLSGHRVRRGTRLLAGLKEGLNTRAVYTTAQDVDLWPITISQAEYLQDKGALKAGGVADRDIAGAEAGLRLVIERNGEDPMAELALDRLDLYLGGAARGAQLFDALFGWGGTVLARPGEDARRFAKIEPVDMVGIAHDEGLLPRVRSSFEGYRLLREYFLMPERFHYLRLSGLHPAVSAAGGNSIEVIVLFDRPQPGLADIDASDFVPFVTPLVNLFERECNIVELDPRRASHVIHADRTRPQDFEIYRLLRVEDAERDGPDAALVSLYSMDQQRGGNLVFATDRKARRPSADERSAGQMRTSYPGDDFHISVARPKGASSAPPIRRLDIRALCTNRDLSILDDTPSLTLDAGDPVGGVQLMQAFRRPRASLDTGASGNTSGEADMDDLSWRWIAQLSLNHISLAEEGRNAEPLRALLELYADRGDPAYQRHARSITRVTSSALMERVPLPGPSCFAHGTEITLEVDDAVLSGASKLLLSAILARLLSHHAAINSFVRTRTRLTQEQKEIAWPLVMGTRSLI